MRLSKRLEALEGRSKDDRPAIIVLNPRETEAQGLQRHRDETGRPPTVRYLSRPKKQKGKAKKPRVYWAGDRGARAWERLRPPLCDYAIIKFP